MLDQRVVCSANKLSNGMIVLGVRHWDSFMCNAFDNLIENIENYECSDLEVYLLDNHEQGFIDQYGNFLTRKEAYVIAEKNNQIVRDIGYETDELYSEHIY